MLQLIVVLFLMSASGEKTEQRFVSRESFSTLAACKAKGAEIAKQFADMNEPVLKGVGFVCIDPGPGV